MLLALAFHNAQLEAAAFREEYDTEGFEDMTVPSYAGITKVCLLASQAKMT